MADINFHLLLMNTKIKRDSYGYSVRPQHLQRYREYGHIYKEEEEERSEKWNIFLDRFAESAGPCPSAGEPCKTSAEAAETSGKPALWKTPEVSDSSGGRSIADSAIEGPLQKRVSIERLMSVCINMKSSMEANQVTISENSFPCNEKSSTKASEEKILEQVSVDSSEKIYLSNDSTESKENSMQCCAKVEISDVRGQETEAQPDACQEDTGTYDTGQRNEGSTNDVPVNEEHLSGDFTSPNFPWKQELESLVHGGIPKSLRGEVWQAFVGVPTCHVERYYQDLLSSEMVTGDSSSVSYENSKSSTTEQHKDRVAETLIKQIEKDLPRTFPGHPALDEEGRNSLRRILGAYAQHNPSVGYCQAMNFFAGILLLLMPEENAFWTLVGIIDDYFDGYYTQDMIESQVDQLVFEELMRERFPRLVHHLDYLGVQVAWISGPWFLSIFVNMLPWESVLRVWDVLLFEGNRVMLFRTALALMELYGPAIVTTKDAGDAITLLQSLVCSTFDSSQLVFTACMGFLAVNESRLQELRSKHRPAVIGLVEERSKGSQVFKDSKLASNLYSFKHDSQALAKEAKAQEVLGVNISDRNSSQPKHSPNEFEELFSSMNIAPELESLPNLEDQVVLLKVELCRALEEKQLAVLRAEELETAFIEMVKEDNRQQLSAEVEQLELEVSQLRQALADKQEQEQAMVQVLMRVEQEHKLTEDARIEAEKNAAAQRRAIHVLQEKYDKAMASLAEAEKRVVMTESMLEATLQYESGQTKTVSSPWFLRQDSSKGFLGRKGLLSFGMGWLDKNKGKPVNVEASGESGSVRQGIQPTVDDPVGAKHME